MNFMLGYKFSKIVVRNYFSINLGKSSFVIKEPDTT